jgi:hypothetical protein
LIIGDEEYVAKKIVDAGHGRGNVSVDEECCLLEAELIRLKRMDTFAKAFFVMVTQRSAEITCMRDVTLDAKCSPLYCS